MNSPLFKLDVRDIVKGLVVAVLTATVAALGNALNMPNFDLFSYDWTSLISVGVTAGIAYILKNVLSDEQGRVGGVL